jgi:flagellar basal-body rod modification protein FlgD
MDITQTQSTTTAPPGGARPPGLASDYMTFLRMLTVQMRNQDPLNPMAASDFAVQLATFAGVEQATQTNQLLTALLARAGLAEMGGWVGMEARLFSGAWFEGAPVSLTPDPAMGATQVTLVVRDANGAVVDSRRLDPAAQTHAWDGRTSDGRLLPTGMYSFELESRRGDEVIDTAPVAAWQGVREVRIEGGQPFLVLPGGRLVEAAAVSGLRRPGG